MKNQYVNWGFCVDNKARNTQQRQRGSTGTKPIITNYI